MIREVTRMCVACRERKSKQELVRIAFNSDYTSVMIDAPKADGRGVYVCRHSECISKCIKTKALNKALKRNLPDNIYAELSRVEING